jgi:diaminopimelate decarboxylase
MGSNYNMVVRPPVVFVRDGEVRQVIRRETYQDLLTRDLGASDPRQAGEQRSLHPDAEG